MPEDKVAEPIPIHRFTRAKRNRQGRPTGLNQVGTPLHEHMTRAVAELTLKGWTRQRIARHGRVRMSVEYVRRLQKQQSFKDMIEELSRPLHERIMERVASKAERAAEKLTEIMENGTPAQKVQLDATKELLHIMGVKPIDVIETRQAPPNPEQVESTRVTLTEIEETINRLSKRDSTFILRRDATPQVTSAETKVDAEPIPASSDRQEAKSA